MPPESHACESRNQGDSISLSEISDRQQGMGRRHRIFERQAESAGGSRNLPLPRRAFPRATEFSRARRSFPECRRELQRSIEFSGRLQSLPESQRVFPRAAESCSAPRNLDEARRDLPRAPQSSQSTWKTLRRVQGFCEALEGCARLRKIPWRIAKFPEPFEDSVRHSKAIHAAGSFQGARESSMSLLKVM